MDDDDAAVGPQFGQTVSDGHAAEERQTAREAELNRIEIHLISIALMPLGMPANRPTD